MQRPDDVTSPFTWLERGRRRVLGRPAVDGLRRVDVARGQRVGGVRSWRRSGPTWRRGWPTRRVTCRRRPPSCWPAWDAPAAETFDDLARTLLGSRGVRAARARAERRGGRPPGRRLRRGPAVRQGLGEHGGRRRGHGGGDRGRAGLRRRPVAGHAGADRLDRPAGGGHRRWRGWRRRRAGGRSCRTWAGRSSTGLRPRRDRVTAGRTTCGTRSWRRCSRSWWSTSARRPGRSPTGPAPTGPGCPRSRPGLAGGAGGAVGAGLVAPGFARLRSTPAGDRPGRARRRGRPGRPGRQRGPAAHRRAGGDGSHQRRGLPGGRHRGGPADRPGRPGDGRLDRPRRRARGGRPLRHGQPDQPGGAVGGRAPGAGPDPAARRCPRRAQCAGGAADREVRRGHPGRRTADRTPGCGRRCPAAAAAVAQAAGTAAPGTPSTTTGCRGAAAGPAALASPVAVLAPRRGVGVGGGRRRGGRSRGNVCGSSDGRQAPDR